MCLYSLRVCCVYYKAGILHNFCFFLLFFFFSSDCWTHRYTLAHRVSLIKTNDKAHPYTASALGTNSVRTLHLHFGSSFFPDLNLDHEGVTKLKMNTPLRGNGTALFSPKERPGKMFSMCVCARTQSCCYRSDTNSHTSERFSTASPTRSVILEEKDKLCQYFPSRTSGCR